jgi:ATP-dependent DNA helicase RecG
VTSRSREHLADLVRELCRLPGETEWVELKRDNADPREIGEYVSALANSAALADKPSAYLVWGVDDTTHDLVGTTFSPRDARVGGEELENWLSHMLSPRIDFRFHELEVGGHPIVLLEIGPAFRHPVRFQGEEFIRVGSYKKKLKDHPEKERALWRTFERTPFEDCMALEDVPVEDVLRLLDYPAYFDLLEQPLPEGRAGILEALESDRLVQPSAAGRWSVTNLGAVLFAKRLADFRPLARKALRVILYKGNSRVETVREHVATKGYANGFEEALGYVAALLPSREVIGPVFRETVTDYPEIAVRELVANALIHQDFTITGAGPMVEIFEDRIEITNPGAPLVRPERFLDSPPRSRNDALASLMRRFQLCEERGSGIDKVALQTELRHLPAPLFEVPDDATRVVLFGPRSLAKMEKGDRIRTCYLHACLKYMNREFLTNSSLRERFGMEVQQSTLISRFIREAVEAGAIAPYDASTAPKYRKYIPYWARAGGT